VYRASVKYTLMLAWHRVCTCRSVGHLLEMAAIVLMLVAGIGTLYVFMNSPAYKRHHPPPAAAAPTEGSAAAPPVRSGDDLAAYFICILFGVTLCMVPFTLRKVFERWRQANSDVDVDIV
jgi:hypothetical protein